MRSIARQDDNAKRARGGVALQGFAPASAPGDELVDRVTEVVARIFSVPVALISLIDEDREHFKATFGSSPVDTARAFAFCELTMRLDRLLVVPDAQLDERFRDNPYVAGDNGIRFYAGAPIVGVDGVAIGALCVIDRVAREADPAQIAVLEQLAELVMPLLELRLETLRAIEVQNELSAVIDASPNAIVTRRRDGVIWGWNDAATRIFGYSREEVIGRLANLSTKEYEAQVFDVLRRVEEDGEFAQGVVVQAVHRDGSILDVEFSAKSIRDSEGRPSGAVYVVDDITESTRQRALERRRYEILELAAGAAPLQEILHRLVELIEASVPDTIGTILRVENGRVHHAASSAAMPAAFGLAIDGSEIGPNEGSCGSAAFLNQTVIVSDIERDPRWEKYRALALPLGLRSCWSVPIVEGPDRVIGTLAFYARTVREPSSADLQHLQQAGHVASIAMTAHDSRVRLEAMALSDILTGLPNRIAFEAMLAESLERAGATGKSLAIGLLGVDRFKTINDSLGHAVGDLLLKEIAARLLRAAALGVTVARMGSDEFAFYVSGVQGRADAEAVAQALVEALDESLAPEGEELYLRATAGLSVFPADGGDAPQLLALAHAAMRAAKARNDRIGFHSGPQTHEGRRRLTLETSLRRALEHDELSVHYQPIVLLETGATIAAEALLRWNNPQLGSISPEVFIPIAEETGTIVALGSWVLREACRFGRKWLDAGGPGAVSVNVSARQFESGDFERIVTDALAATGLPPEKLCLEITESMILRSPEAVFTAITRLRSLGVHCAIDDFGTGYSSLSRLMSFRIDALKIDRSFLRDIGNPEAAEACALVRALVNVGRSMGLSVIAEGVETKEQRAFLMASECESAQGYLYARPIPEGEMLTR
jgi:diguanylate cyclase (GGDEF)-like protein/PAS domain S-box-containing protein